MNKEVKDKKPREPEETSEGVQLCTHCESQMVIEEGKTICPNCDGEIDFFGDKEE